MMLETEYKVERTGQRLVVTKGLAIMFACLFSVCILLKWMNDYTLLMWLGAGICASLLLRNATEHFKVNSWKTPVDWSRLRVEEMFKHDWMLVGVIFGYLCWLLACGITDSVVTWLQTSHVISLTTYGIVFLYLWYNRYNDFSVALAQMCLCAASFEFMNIICAIYLYGLANVSKVSYSVLFGFIPLSLAFFQGKLKFGKMYYTWLIFSIAIQIYTIYSGSLGVIQYFPELGTWSQIYTFETVVWGTLLSIVAKATNAIAFKYVYIKLN